MDYNEGEGHVSGLIVGVCIALWKVKQWLPPIPLEHDSHDNDDADENGRLDDPYIHL